MTRFTMLRRWKDIQPARFFVIAALVFELLLTLVTPPLQAPDEFSHFYRAYQVSEGYFLPIKQNQRLGGYLPAGIIDFSTQYQQPAYIMNYTLTHREIARSFKIDLQADQRRFTDFANTAYYSPVSYLPQALALFVLRQFHSPPALLYYGGRLLIFLLWLLSMYWVIKSTPVFKWLLTLLILLPMNPYLANSFSADTVTNILALVFITCLLRHIFVTKAITRRHLLVLAAVLALLALAKVVYIGLAVLLFAIPAHKFSGRSQRFISLALLFLVSAFLSGWWSNAVMKLYIPFKDYNPDYRAVACLSPCGDYYAQQDYVLNHGFYFFKVIWHSLTDHPGFFLRGYIGVFGNGDIGLPDWLYVVAYLLILLLALTETKPFRFTALYKTWLLMAAGCAFVLLLLSQHLIWDCVGEGVVDMLQGRYLIPLLPLLLITLPNVIPLRLPVAGLLAGFVLLADVFAAKAIYARFFVGPPAQTTQFYCSAEERDGFGAFKTSDTAIYLGEGNNQTTVEHREGNFSVLLSPASPFCFTYKFKGLHKGDLVEAETWQKGEGALLVVSGKQDGCGEFYFAGTFKSYRDKAGWQRIKNVCSVSLDCDSAEMAFYAWNPGKKDIYLDDLKIKITRFIKEKE